MFCAGKNPWGIRPFESFDILNIFYYYLLYLLNVGLSLNVVTMVQHIFYCKLDIGIINMMSPENYFLFNTLWYSSTDDVPSFHFVHILESFIKFTVFPFLPNLYIQRLTLNKFCFLFVWCSASTLILSHRRKIELSPYRCSINL